MYDAGGLKSSGGTQYRHRTTIRAFECSILRTRQRFPESFSLLWPRWGYDETGKGVLLPVAPTTIESDEKSTFSGRRGTLRKHSWKTRLRRLTALSLQMEDKQETFATGCSCRMVPPRQMTSNHE